MSATRQLVELITSAADFGHCLECGADIPLSNAMTGTVLCKPCDAVAAAHDAEAEAMAAELLPRILHELETTRTIGERAA